MTRAGYLTAFAGVLLGASAVAHAETLTIATVNNSDMIIMQKLSSKWEQQTGNKLNWVVLEENVLVQLENLRTHPAVAAALSRGRLKLHGWVYSIEKGEVFAFDPERGQFLPLVETPAGTPAPSITQRSVVPI